MLRLAMKQTLIQRILDPKQRLTIHEQSKTSKQHYRSRLLLKAAKALHRRGKKPRKKGRGFYASLEKKITPLFDGRHRFHWRRPQWRFRTVWGAGIILVRIESKLAQARPGHLRRYWSRKRLDAMTHIRQRIALAMPKIELWDAETRKRQAPFLEQLKALQHKIGDRRL